MEKKPIYKRYTVRFCMSGRIVSRVEVAAPNVTAALREAASFALRDEVTGEELLDYDEVRVVTEVRVAEEQREREKANAN